MLGRDAVADNLEHDDSDGDALQKRAKRRLLRVDDVDVTCSLSAPLLPLMTLASVVAMATEFEPPATSATFPLILPVAYTIDSPTKKRRMDYLVP